MKTDKTLTILKYSFLGIIIISTIGQIIKYTIPENNFPRIIRETSGAIIAGICLFLLLLYNQDMKIYTNTSKNSSKRTYRCIFLIIIGVFCTIKIPYLNQDFNTTGASNKYTSYIQPAQNMIKNDPFTNQKDYLKSFKGDPFQKNGTYKAFSSYPILERTLAATKYTFPSLSRESTARLVMMIIGILFLLSTTTFLNHFFPKGQTLFILALLAINPLIQSFTFLTVLDPINLTILFFSLHLLIRGLESDNKKTLYLTGVLAGIGICIKYHAIIFSLPFFISLLYFYKKSSPTETLANALLILPNFILQTAFFRVSVRHLPSNPTLFGSLSLLMVGIQIILYTQANNIYRGISYIINKIGIKKIYWMIGSTILLSLIAIFAIPQFGKMGANFLTDKDFIFNSNIYLGIIKKTISQTNNLSYILYIIIFIGLLFLPFHKKQKLLLFTAITTGVIYTIVASKILYSHIYYHHIYIITICCFIGILYSILNIYTRKWKIIFISVFIILNGLLNKDEVMRYIDPRPNFLKEIGTYIKKQTKENESIIMNESSESSIIISLYSERNFYQQNTLTQNYLKQHKEENIKKLMNIYNIRYIITCPMGNTHPQRRYDLFKKPEQKISKIDIKIRSILCTTKNLYCDTLPEYEPVTLEALDFFAKKILPQLSLEKKIGDCGIYSFKDNMETQK